MRLCDRCCRDEDVQRLDERGPAGPVGEVR